MQVLLIEDSIRLAETIQDFLRLKKINTIIKTDGEEGYEEALTGVYDIIILDIMLPSKDGFSILKDLRKRKIQTPIIMLTAKIQIEDKIQGFEDGADDYLTKPFDFNELYYRIRALARRKEKKIETNPSFGDITLNEEKYQIKVKNNKAVLTQKEFELLLVLIEAKGNIVSKEYLFDKVWPNVDLNQYNSVEVYISFLRKRLKLLESKYTIISVRNAGYKLDEKAI